MSIDKEWSFGEFEKCSQRIRDIKLLLDLEETLLKMIDTKAPIKHIDRIKEMIEETRGIVNSLYGKDLPTTTTNLEK